MTPAFLRLLLLGLLALPSCALAHRLDEYLQATLVTIEPEGIRLQINLIPGVAVAGQVLALVDGDGDEKISEKEAAAYAESLKGDLIARLDERDAKLKLTAFKFSEAAELRAGLGIIQVEFSITPGPLKFGRHRLTLNNGHLPALSVYLFNAAQPTSRSIQIATQRRNENQSVGEIAFTFR